MSCKDSAMLVFFANTAHIRQDGRTAIFKAMYVSPNVSMPLEIGRNK